MSSKTTDEATLIEVPVDLSTSEDVEGSTLESRSERIRRLNRERQRRRRMKLKMSRHGEPSMASEASNVSMNLDNLETLENAKTGLERTENTVKVEIDVPKSGIAATKSTRSRSSRRKRPYSELVSTAEDTNPGASDAVSAIAAAQCHGPTSSNELSTATDQLSVLAVATEIEVFGENPNVLNGGENVEAQNQLQSEDIDEANKRSTRSRIALRREDEEEPRMRRKRSSTNSDEEVTVRREKQRELKRKQKERMTPEQVEALRARYREWRRKRKEVMTSEQLEIIRRGNRERQRRRRERLGVRKRLSSTSSQGRGASEAVIQGLKNISQGRTASETSTSGESSKGSVSDLMSASGIVIDDKTAAHQAVCMSPSSLPTMVTPSLPQNGTNQSTVTASVSTTYNQVPTSQQAISAIPVLGPQGTILPAMPAGTFFPGVAMPGMQVFPGVPVPVTGSQANLVPGNPNITAITTIPMSGVPGIQTAQGGFLSGIPVTSTSGNAQTIQQAFPSQSHLQRDGQVLHNFQTLLPMTPVQAPGQGMTFLTQLPFTGATAGQVQTIVDPKYTVANQTTTQVQGVPPVAQIVQVPIPVEDSKPVENPKATQGKKPKSRGRKRNTSAAEMLASLSTYMPQSTTPMSSMLSALASSARDRQSTEVQVQVSEPNAIDRGKTETVVLEASNTVPQTVVLPQVGQVGDQQALNMYVAQQRGIDGQPFMVRTMVTSSSTHSTIDVNSNNFALAALNNGPTIPHMNTFLTAIGTGGQAQRPSTQPVNITRDPSQAVSNVSVSSEKVSRVSKATNTDKGAQADSLSSVGTMTDSLYRSSVATNTDLAVAFDESNQRVVNPVEGQP